MAAEQAEPAVDAPSQAAFSPFVEISVRQPPPAADQAVDGEWSPSLVGLAIALVCIARLLRMLAG